MRTGYVAEPERQKLLDGLGVRQQLGGSGTEGDAGSSVACDLSIADGSRDSGRSGRICLPVRLHASSA